MYPIPSFKRNSRFSLSGFQRGNTALHEASAEGHVHTTLLLLALGASVIVRSREGLTCLMSACAGGHLQMAKLLIAAGCDIHTSNKVNAWWWGGDVCIMMVVVVVVVCVKCPQLAVPHDK
jgi:ankyrin repeat protein